MMLNGTATEVKTKGNATAEVKTKLNARFDFSPEATGSADERSSLTRRVKKSIKRFSRPPAKRAENRIADVLPGTESRPNDNTDNVEVERVRHTDVGLEVSDGHWMTELPDLGKKVVMEADNQETDGRPEKAKAKESSESRLDVDRGYAWVIVLASFCTHFLLTGYGRSGGVLFVEFQNQFHSSSSMTSLIIGIQEVVCSIVAFIFLGFVLEKTSPRFVCLIGSVFLTIGVTGNFLATSFPFLMFTHGFCIGVALGTSYGASLIVISHYFVQRRALATAIVMTGASSGGTALPFVTRYLLKNYGFHGGFLLLGGIICHCFVFTLLLVPAKKLTPADEQETCSEDANLTQDSKRSEHEDTFSCDIDCVKPETQCQRYSADVSDKNANSKLDNDDNENDAESCQEKEYLMPSDPTDRDNDEERSFHVVPSTFNSEQNISNRIAHQDESQNQARLSMSSREQIPLDHKETLSSSGVKNSSSHCPDANNGHVFHASSVERNDGPPLLTTKSQLISGKHKLHQLSLFQSTSTLHSIADLTNLTRDSTVKATPGQQEHETCSCSSALRKIIHRDLTHSASFWYLCFFFIISWLAQLISIIYVPALAKERGLSDDDGAFFMSLLNILDLPSRLIPGIIVNTGYVKASKVCLLPMTAVGIVGYFTPLMNSYQSLLVLVVIYGLCTGVYISMQTLIIIEVAGIKHYPSALAFYYLVMSVGSTSFFPIAGLMKDSTGTYSTPYFYLASMELASVVLLLCLPAVKRLDLRRGVLT